MSGIYLPNAGGIEMLKRQLYGRGKLISDATNASPTVITSTAHGLANGTLVTIAGATGNTAINGTFVVCNATADTFQIATIAGSTLTLVNGTGVFAGTCFWTLAGMEAGRLKYYSNNITPAEGDVAGTYVEMAGGNGYVSGGFLLNSLIQASGQQGWVPPATVSGGGTNAWASSLGSGSTNVPESTYDLQSITFTATASAFGYFVVGAQTGTIWWSERFGGGLINFAIGLRFDFTPRIGETHV